MSSVHEKIKQKVYLTGYHYHIFHLFYYFSDITRYGLAFYQHENKARYQQFRVRRSILHAIVPAIITFLFGVRGAIYLFNADYYNSTRARQLLIFTAFFPDNGREVMEITLFCWSAMHVGYVFYVLRERLLDYCFLAVLLVDEKGSKGVKPEHLDLNPDELAKLVRMRRQLLRLPHVINCTVICVADAALMLQIMQKSLWQVNIWHLIFWWLYWQIWILYANCFAYAVPVFVMIIVTYLRIKQETVLNELNRVVTFLEQMRNMPAGIKRTRRYQTQLFFIYRKILQLNVRYNWLVKEVKDYNRFISRFLNLVFMVFILIITYITYVLFVAGTPLDFRFVYMNVFIAHISLLSLTIFGCASVCKTNKLVGHTMYRVLNRVYQAGYFTPYQLLKLDMMAQFRRYKCKVGFSLATRYTIDYNAYIMVFYVISSFFLMNIKRGIKL